MNRIVAPIFTLTFALFALLLVGFAVAAVTPAQAQSTRPRRVKPAPSPTPDSLLGPEPKPSPVANNNAPLLDVKPAKPVGNAPVSTDTTHAFQLFQQKQYAAAAREAKEIATNDPGNAELAITVGSTHREMPHVYGVSYFSSKGPTGDGRMKPDVVAPGEKILSAATGKLLMDRAEGKQCEYVEDSGTSMAEIVA